jgi:hypothetical protein
LVASSHLVSFKACSDAISHQLSHHILQCLFLGFMCFPLLAAFSYDGAGALSRKGPAGRCWI